MPVTAANRTLISRQAQILEALGVQVTRVGGHETRCAREDINSTPYFFGVHHTGSDGTPLATIRDGYTGLPGPLANWYVPRDVGRRVYLVADGYTNHGGAADQAPLTEVKDGDVDKTTITPGADDPGVYANRWAHAVEVAAKGPFTPDQYFVTLALAASFAIATDAHLDKDGDGRWIPALGHKEWTRRKVDPVFDMAIFRAEAQKMAEAYLAGAAPTIPTPTPEPVVPTGVPASLTVDGQMGPRTIGAVQWSLGLAQTAVYGEGTRKALQKWLGVTVDGIIGPKTGQALQGWLDVVADGVIGPKTISRWQQWLNVLIVAAGKRPRAKTTGDPFRMGFANLQGYDGRQNVQTQAETLAARVGASGYALCETDRARRRAVEAAHGSTWWCWAHPGGTVAAAADLAKWDPPTPAQLRKASYGTRYGHGALCVPLVRRSNGRKVDLISTHTRPAAVASVDDKRHDISAAAGLARGNAAILAGDFAMNPRAQLGELGWRAVSPNADSMTRDGVQRVDAALVRNYGVEARGSALVDPGPQSDHMWGRVSLTALPASQPSPL